MTDSATPGLFPDPIPPAPPAATPADRVEMLVRLRARRRELVDAFAVGLALGEPLSASAMQPLATIQAAIAAVEAELGADDPDCPPATV